MKTERNILIALLLNLSFTIFEILGGLLTGSIAIISDAIHDLGDAISIAISYLLEKKSKQKPDIAYTFGYSRYSVLGSLVTTTVLVVGSIITLYNGVMRIATPVDVHYDGMIIFAIVGVAVNAGATYFTRSGESLNQKAVNLHMLEDVLGWLVVLLGAIIMKFTNMTIIDPLMSVAVSAFVLSNALKNGKQIIDVLLEKTPTNMPVDAIISNVLAIDGVESIHHLHVWTLDGVNALAMMHIVLNKDKSDIKKVIRENLKLQGIKHVNIELERVGEACIDSYCHIEDRTQPHQHYHSQ
ncbi:TPA: cation transporter [Streptococcus suis]|nr:cation transporter [Streptococcus suis]